MTVTNPDSVISAPGRSAVWDNAPCAFAAASAWVCAVALLLISAWAQMGFSSPVWGPDDAMRLVQIRDWLGGQGWSDLTQYRLDPASPVVMHWSRIVDLPVAGAILALKPLLGGPVAERAALILWPFTLLFVMFWLLARVCRRTGGPAAMWIGAGLPLFAASVLGEFLPGRIDHHGLQMVLCLAMLLTVLQAHRDVRAALLAGATAPLLLAVGLEPLPIVAAAAAALGLRWIMGGGGAALAMRGFGAGMGFAAPALYWLTAPQMREAVNACDAFSSFHLAAMLAAGAGMVLLGGAGERLRPGWRRLAAGAALGLAVLAAAGVTAPHCFAAPYAGLDPRLGSLWLAQVIEAQGAAALFAHSPEKLLTWYAMPVAGFTLCVWRVLRSEGDERYSWLTLSLFIGMALLLAAYQIRGAKFAMLFAAPPGAWLIARCHEVYSGAAASARNVALARLAGAMLLFVAAFHASAAGALAAITPSYGTAAGPVRDSLGAEDRKCWAGAVLRPLGRLAPGLVLAPRNIGAHLLLETPHSVLAANYHRGGRGILTAMDLYNEPDHIAHALALAEGVDYVVECPGMGTQRADGATAPDSLASALEHGHAPSWLRPVPLPPGNPLKVYRVAR